MDIDKIISIVRELKEEGVVPTVNLGSSGQGKIAGTVQAGDDPPVKNRYIYMKNSRINWLQRRKPPQV